MCMCHVSLFWAIGLGHAGAFVIAASALHALGAERFSAASACTGVLQRGLKPRGQITNSAFGTAFGVVDGRPFPVCDHAGYAPFGFGYRRCPGEPLSSEVFGDFLRKVWADKIEFEQLDVASASKVPIGPVTVIDDVIGFRRRL